MKNFKLVIFDYPKQQLDKTIAQRVLSDLIVSKQQNFVRTSEDYVVMDKHDMIGTHFLIYETSDIFNPKLILALRCTYEDRAKKHRLSTPMQDLAVHLPPETRQAYDEFRQQFASENLVDCNSWFVDPNFSFKNSGLPLSDIGFTMVYLQLTRMGYKRFWGCTNEKYHAHRWVANISNFKKGYEFIHPTVPDSHMLTMVESFNLSYLKSVYETYQELFDNMLEVTPDIPGYKNIHDTLATVFGANETTQKVVPLVKRKAG